MVMREVPLDAARDPCAEHADQRGLDDVLAIEGLEAGLPVGQVQQVSAVFREDAHLQPVILERQVLVGLVGLLVVQDILHRIGIDAPLCALIDAPRIEDRRLVIPSRRVCRQRDRVLLVLHRLCQQYRRSARHDREHHRFCSVLHFHRFPLLVNQGHFTSSLPHMQPISTRCDIRSAPSYSTRQSVPPSMRTSASRTSAE